MERSEETIFAKALEKPAEQRAGYLDEACAGEPELRKNVESLLEAYSEGEFLESPAHDIGTTIELPLTEKPGAQIGPYKLLQQIGEGGMGVVYMAEQTEPVERRVALKIIKPGLDTRQVIARFEAERQALAMMDHPHIAKVLDAGTTDAGRPYFVMELVKGVPITNYCDERHLTPRERLELFVPVCQAIQHAHQKGIIHRDIKPSNVLVAHYDDLPSPKVIDFGVAKAIDHRLTEKTMFTEYGQVLGTIEYMSPEQARLNQWDVDTRSDVYSLGVLLYELLSGEVPFNRERLRSAAFDELLRIIREEEPPRPSTRLSTSESLPTIAANRKTEPRTLSTLIHGELDWIVMKSLEKDRTRRYETANKLAEDVEHYLANETVEACPPSISYRLQKFTRRNKAAIATLSLIATALLMGTLVASWQAIRALEAEQLANERLLETEAEKERAVKAEQRATANAQRLEIALRETRQVFERFRLTGNLARAYQSAELTDRPQIPDHVFMGGLHEELVLWLQAGTSLLLMEDHEAYVRLCEGMAQRFQHTSNIHAAERTCKLCCMRPGIDRPSMPVSVLDDALKGHHMQVAPRPWELMTRALAYYRDGDYDQARTHSRSSLALVQDVWAHLRNAVSATNYAVAAMAAEQQGDRNEATKMLQLAIDELDNRRAIEGGIEMNYVFAETLVNEARGLIQGDSR